MFINDVMSEVWNSRYKEYIKILKFMEEKDINELKNLCKKDIDKLSEKVFVSDNHSLTIIETIGCQHQFRNDRISGCSFCDWDSTRISEIARLRVLLEKDKEAYGDVLKYSFQKIRGSDCSPCLIEQISIHDVMDSKQFPEEAFKKLFIEESVYRTRPNIGIISARAANVRDDKIKEWKKVFKRALTVGIGIEVGNEWIRNHWLNKNTSNEQVENAVRVIHNNGAKVCANIILGVSGLCDKNALEIFFDTCRYILEIGVDFILISPLIVKEKSLGRLINENKNGCEGFLSVLLAEAVYGINEKFGAHISKFTFSPDNFEDSIQNSYGEEKEYLKGIFQSIGNMGKVYTVREFESFLEFYNQFSNSDYYKNNVNKMDSGLSIKEELKNVAKYVALKLWSEDKRYEEFVEEINEFDLEEIRCVL